MNAVTLDWSAAEVSDGRLEVPLQGGFSKGWKEDFDRTVALLPSGDWGEVTLKKETVMTGRFRSFATDGDQAEP